MGRIPFRDVIAYSRNVAVSRVAARLGRTTAQRRGDPVPDVAEAGHRACGPASTCPGRGRGHRGRPRTYAVGAHRPRQPRLRPGRGRDAHPAGDRVHAHDQRRHARPAPLPGRRSAAARRTWRHRDRVLTEEGGRPAAGDHAPRHGGGALVRRRARSSRTTRWAARPARRRSGSAQATGCDRNTYNFTFVGYVGGDEPAAVVAVHIDEAKSLIRDRATSAQHHVVSAVPAGRAGHHPAPRRSRRSSDPNAGRAGARQRARNGSMEPDALRPTHARHGPVRR